MYTGVWSPLLWILAKSAVFGISAGGILWRWKRRGIRSRNLYSASRANLAFYSLWLTVVIVMFVMQESSALRSMINSSLPASLFVGCTFFAVIGSLLMCISCLGAEKGERRFVVLANGLMLILWASNVVAPN